MQNAATQRFTLVEIQAMPQCFGPEWAGLLAPDGFLLWQDKRGKLIVTFVPRDVCRAYSVCPIIRVPVRSAPVGKYEQ